jgi:hypothetical protein
MGSPGFQSHPVSDRLWAGPAHLCEFAVRRPVPFGDRCDRGVDPGPVESRNRCTARTRDGPRPDW